MARRRGRPAHVAWTWMVVLGASVGACQDTVWFGAVEDTGDPLGPGVGMDTGADPADPSNSDDAGGEESGPAAPPTTAGAGETSGDDGPNVPDDGAGEDPETGGDAIEETDGLLPWDLCPGRECLEPEAVTCQSYYDAGARASGPYWLDLDGNEPGTGFMAECDMETDGGGWTVVTPELAREYLGAELVAFEEAPVVGLDAEGRPFTQDEQHNHTYAYEFTFAAGFSEFALRDYVARAITVDYTTEITPEKFVQTDWSIAHGPSDVRPGSGAGDVSFGDASAPGPVTSFAAQGAGVQCNNCELPWPLDREAVSVGDSATVFRIGWGEAGAQFEGWYPWYAGEILLRHIP